MKIDDQTIISRNKDIVFSDIEGESILLDVKAGSYYQFNPTASRIWALLSTPQSLKKLCVMLQREYDVSYETCKSDVVESISEMAESNILTIVPLEVPG